jgi:hypothetical protein
MKAFDSLLPPGEGARRADEGMGMTGHSTPIRSGFFFPHPALRATFSRREKEMHAVLVPDTSP